MTFNLDGFTVTIMAKRNDKHLSDGRKKDLAVFLTRLACHEWCAQELNKTQGCEATANENRKYALMFSDLADELRGETA